jgi:ketosteroid isomerase-like protein
MGVGGEADLDVVQRLYAAFAARDVEAALALVADDGEFVAPFTVDPTGEPRTYRGRAGVRAYFADAARDWDAFSAHVTDMRATPGSVVVFGHVIGRAGDRETRRDVVWFWGVRDGLAVSLQVNDVGEWGGDAGVEPPSPL